MSTVAPDLAAPVARRPFPGSGRDAAFQHFGKPEHARCIQWTRRFIVLDGPCVGKRWRRVAKPSITKAPRRWHTV